MDLLENIRLDGGPAKPVAIVNAGVPIVGTTPRVQTPTGPVVLVAIGPGDVISNIPVMIDYPHHQVHEGETYCYTYVATAQNGAKDFRIVVPNVEATTRTPHMVAEVIGNSTLTRLYWYEGTTWTSGGVDDSANIFNRNRNVITAAGTKIYVAGGTALTVNALGANIWQGILFAGKNAASETESRAGTEWDLKSNTEYCFRVTTADASAVLVRFEFYEDRGV
jgi:hypothetical protein